MKTYYVYLYTDPSKNDEVIYVGKGSNDYRCKYHLARKDNHPLTERIQNMASVGIEPTITRIECSSEQISYDLEKGLINLIGRKILNTGTLLNLADGGIWGGGFLNKGKPKSAETRAKMSAAKKGVRKSPEHRKNNSIYQKGRRLSIETRTKMSIAKQNIKPESKAKMSAAKKGRTWKVDETTGKRVWL